MTERNCRLYLLVPDTAAGGFAECFGEAIGAGDVACVAMPAPDAGALDTGLAGDLIDLAHANGVPFLTDGPPATAQALRADGVHIAADEALYAEARRTLGADAIVGAACGPSRHEAMMLAELGADYVAFGPDPSRAAGHGPESRLELIAWWADLIEVPCVAWDVRSLEEARAAAAAGADFVAVGALVWEHPRSPADAVREINGALARDAA